MNTFSEHGFRNKGLANIHCAFASAAAFTSASRLLGESVIPGSTGAIATPARNPTSLNFRTASSRRSGRGARGSSKRASSTSVVVTVRLIESSFCWAIFRKRSMSRKIMFDLVMMLTSNPECSESSSRMERVIPKRRSAG